MIEEDIAANSKSVVQGCFNSRLPFIKVIPGFLGSREPVKHP